MTNRDRGAPHPGRNRQGEFTRTLDTAGRDADACRLRAQGYTYQQIADELDFSNKGDAHHAVSRALREVVREPAEELLKIELDRLDAQLVRLKGLEVEARRVLDAPHIVVSNGHVIHHPDTDLPMEDDAPILQAIDRLVKIEDARNRNAERRAKLTGVEAAVKVEATVHEVTQQDLELQELIRDARARVATQEQALKNGTETSGT
ncbi:hypothetical protein ABZX40_13530 [Streptomyces sp. NPDC004610]|uniref:hypothetical protein n=1 Tax=unclassified Streptomyces TaxID=2593676 RepID=UPI0033A785FB